jgi:hypothetical protein
VPFLMRGGISDIKNLMFFSQSCHFVFTSCASPSRLKMEKLASFFDGRKEFEFKNFIKCEWIEKKS